MSIDFSKVPRQSWIGRALRLPLRLLPAGMVVPVVQGPLRGMYWVVGSYNHGCWLGSYEQPAQQIFRKLIHEGSVVYDIGANVGFFTLLASKLSGRSGKVYAFEPVSQNRQMLQSHLELNH